MVPTAFAALEEGKMVPAYTTQYGRAYCADSRELLRLLPADSIDLIMTSPPYALVKQKEYGNEAATGYLEWFMEFGREFWRVLKPSGSLVVNIGGTYLPGSPTRSLYHFEMLIRLCRDLGFHLAQEFYWFNPAKMPAPAEWVTIRRIRVRDSVEPVWWLSKEPYPKADNRRVLREYGEAMLDLLDKGYNQGPRPSGHDVSDKWGRDNGGAIPPNVFEIASDGTPEDLWLGLLSRNLIRVSNTASKDRYQTLCRLKGLRPHPARFPVELPRFFIRFLTDPRDVVLDPFGGSGTTGAAAEADQRYWMTCDSDLGYVEASALRFSEVDADSGQREPGTVEQIRFPLP